MMNQVVARLREALWLAVVQTALIFALLGAAVLLGRMIRTKLIGLALDVVVWWARRRSRRLRGAVLASPDEQGRGLLVAEARRLDKMGGKVVRRVLRPIERESIPARLLFTDREMALAVSRQLRAGGLTRLEGERALCEAVGGEDRSSCRGLLRVLTDPLLRGSLSEAERTRLIEWVLENGGESERRIAEYWRAF
jgi:hypothetical protein